MPKSLILHDWNGCLLDDVPHRFQNSVVPIFRHYGLKAPTLEQYCHEITSDFMSFYYAYGIPDSGDRKADGDALNRIMVASMAGASVPPLFPETRQFLETLRGSGRKQVLVSALPTGAFDQQFNHHGLHDYFLETHSDIRQKAPKFEELMAKYGAKPEDAIGVTDTMSDIRALEAVGVRGIIVPRAYVQPDVDKHPQILVAKDLLHALELISEQ